MKKLFIVVMIVIFTILNVHPVQAKTHHITSHKTQKYYFVTHKTPKKKTITHYTTPTITRNYFYNGFSSYWNQKQIKHGIVFMFIN